MTTQQEEPLYDFPEPSESSRAPPRGPEPSESISVLEEEPLYDFPEPSESSRAPPRGPEPLRSISVLEEEPLYDFPEPSESSRAPPRGRESIRTIGVLDRLLLTVPVWLQLSINPATALHILQREPPGAFLVRKSRTSLRNVLCVRLADDSIPSFVQQFSIREEHSTFCLETSAITFPDVPKLIAFYCTSRDVLPFHLELPEAIAKARSQKQLESISHMGIEFWSSQLNFRGPRDTPKVQEEEEETRPHPETAPLPVPTSHPMPTSEPIAIARLTAPPQTAGAVGKDDPSPTTFQEFCPIKTRSPREVNFGTSQGALCFINPLFLQSHNTLHRRHIFKRSLKIRVSTETSSLLSPPTARPPPPPLMPKKRGRCKAKDRPALAQEDARRPEPTGRLSPPGPIAQEDVTEPLEVQLQTETENIRVEDQMRAKSPGLLSPSLPKSHGLISPGLLSPGPLSPGLLSPGLPSPGLPSKIREGQTQTERGQVRTDTGEAAEATGPTIGSLPDSDYMQPSPRVNAPPSPYLSPSVSPRTPPSLFPKASSPSLFPKASLSSSPRLSPLLPPRVPFSLSPATSPSTEDAYHTPTGAALTTHGQGEKRGEHVEERTGRKAAGVKEMRDEENREGAEEEDMGLLLQHMCAASLNDLDSCSSSLSSLEEAAETTPPPSPLL